MIIFTCEFCKGKSLNHPWRRLGPPFKMTIILPGFLYKNVFTLGPSEYSLHMLDHTWATSCKNAIPVWQLYCRPMTKGHNWQFCQNWVSTITRSRVTIFIIRNQKTPYFRLINPKTISSKNEFMYKSMRAKHSNWQLSQNNQYVSYCRPLPSSRKYLQYIQTTDLHINACSVSICVHLYASLL